jgi:glycosyltransferase involved in cell wall biosynthesis
MATFPYFALSPNAILSIVGLLHGPDDTVPTPPEDWRQATVDVVIPALNEESNIALCLASLARQTMKPKRIILIDDGSSDHTIEYAQTFCQLSGMELVAIHRQAPIGKTPTLKRQSREFDSNVEFILDADTVLESENYIARTVEELYKGVGIASACGTILPLRDHDRRALLETEALQKFLSAKPEASIYPKVGWLRHLQRGLSDLYRDVLYMFLQRFVYHGQMVFFGSILNPVGCAVAYRREVLKSMVFDRYEPILGDDLTNSEDIFIGFAFTDNGYRNIQLMDVYARSQEPEARRIPHQVYLWSSSFLQSCFYFDELMRSPFKAPKRYLHHRREQREIGQEIAQKRKIKEQYRQAFGVDYTLKYGRPIGWVLFMSAVEKIAFPTVLVMMAIMQLWWAIGYTVLLETVLSLAVLFAVAKGHRFQYLLKGIAVVPMRYMVILFDLVTMFRFAADLWIFGNRRWRK